MPYECDLAMEILENTRFKLAWFGVDAVVHIKSLIESCHYCAEMRLGPAESSGISDNVRTLITPEIVIDTKGNWH